MISPYTIGFFLDVESPSPKFNAKSLTALVKALTVIGSL